MASKVKFDINNSNLNQPKNDTALSVAPQDLKGISPLYYDTATLQPLSLSVIEKRIEKNFNQIDRSEAQIALDLFVTHENWKTFYNREDSWTNWMKEHIPRNRSHVYDLIKIVRAIRGTVSIKRQAEGLMDIPDYDELLHIIEKPMENSGVFKLKIASQVKDEDIRFQLLGDILDGKAVDDDFILSLNRTKKIIEAQEADTDRILEAEVIRDDEEPVKDMTAPVFEKETGGFKVKYFGNGEIKAFFGKEKEFLVGVLNKKINLRTAEKIAYIVLEDMIVGEGNLEE
ncbi:MAG: hypothetical protein HPY53_01660 [Brevinematales bacterium]|nr:hypothetical protein [Brevinematales bacterium]